MSSVLYLTNVSSPYRVNYFNLLGEKYDVTVFYEYEKEPTENRDVSWEDAGAVHYKPRYSYRCSEMKNYDHVVVCGISTKKEIAALLWLKSHHIPYYLEIDGGFPKADNFLKKAVKTFLISGAKAYFSTADISDLYLTTYGADPDRIYRYPFTSIYEKDIIRSFPSQAQKTDLSSRLGISEKTMLLAVGQFIPRKGYDILLKAASEIDKNIGIYLIGGKPTNEYIQIKESLGLTNVHFLPFMQKEQLQLYYDAADLLIHPTREGIWGLVVNEAMARGLPVVTTDRCIAGLAMIRDGINGRIIPANDEKALESAINESLLATDAMSHAAMETAHEYTLEKMTDAHIHVFSIQKEKASSGGKHENP